MPLKERLNWVSIAKTVIAIVVIVMLGWYLIQVDFKEVWAQVSAVRWSFGYVMITTCTAYLLATEAWRQCFPKDLPLPSLGKMFMIRQIGETLTMLTPANVIGGEASKVYMLDKYGIPSTASTSSVVISRGLIILSYLSLGVVAGVLILLGQAQRFGVVAFLIVCAGVIVGGIVGIRALRTFILSRDKQ
ncbi:MAG: lysylphosphatidylglycerol synthase domain-containing protein, partial [Bacteroidota bacterium]